MSDYVSNSSENEPLVIGENKNKAPRAMRTLFVLKGKEYKVPVKMDPRVTLRLLRIIRDAKTDDEKALAELTASEALLGTENMDALLNDEDVSPEEFEAVMKAAVAHAMGAAESAKN